MLTIFKCNELKITFFRSFTFKQRQQCLDVWGVELLTCRFKFEAEMAFQWKQNFPDLISYECLGEFSILCETSVDS